MKKTTEQKRKPQTFGYDYRPWFTYVGRKEFNNWSMRRHRVAAHRCCLVMRILHEGWDRSRLEQYDRHTVARANRAILNRRRP